MTLERYVRAKQVELARGLHRRAKIYLDVNFWIVLRETAVGKRTGAAERKLLHLLRRGVARGRLVCPISDSFFMELLKQPFREDRRIGTARLVDELSLGVTITNSRLRTGTEICSFLWGAQPGVILHPMQDLVWTKLIYVLGESHPFSSALSPERLLDLQKAFVDRAWSSTLTEMVLSIGDQRGPDPFARLCVETNLMRDQHADEITDFNHAYEIEIRGAISASGELAAEAVCGWAERNGVPPPARGTAEWVQVKGMAMNLLVAAFANDEAKKLMRTLHIEACLHASLRCDKPRRFKANDVYDYHHATAAIGYCDFFFTEAPLCSLANREQLGLGSLNGCRIIAEIDEAVDLVRGLETSAAWNHDSADTTPI